MICVRGWECGGINLTMMIFMAFPTHIFNGIREFSSIFPTRCRAGAFIFIRGTQIFYWFDARCFLSPRKLQRSLKNEQSSVNETEWLIVHVLLFPWIRFDCGWANGASERLSPEDGSRQLRRELLMIFCWCIGEEKRKVENCSEKKFSFGFWMSCLKTYRMLDTMDDTMKNEEQMSAGWQKENAWRRKRL